MLSLAGLWLNYKKHGGANYITYILLVVSFVGSFFAVQTGISGGEIRHTEIRNGAVTTNAAGMREDDMQEKDEKALKSFGEF